MFDQLYPAGIPPSVTAHNSWMAVIAGAAALGKAGLEDGWRVLERMAAQGVPANVCTYTSLMAVVAGAARHGTAGFKEGEQVLEHFAAAAQAVAAPEAQRVMFNALLAVAVGAAHDGRASFEVDCYGHAFEWHAQSLTRLHRTGLAWWAR